MQANLMCVNERPTSRVECNYTCTQRGAWFLRDSTNEVVAGAPEVYVGFMSVDKISSNKKQIYLE